MNSKRTDVDALLNETPWVRRIARSLLRDEAHAEDLSQEVLAATLAKPPGLAGDSLRGWLATVMKRMASRTREREQGRERAEKQAARPEANETNVSARIELHKRLSEAVEATDEPYRTALVLRYFDELAPREIAARLDITPVAARKRVSRGLALLRVRLDEEFDGGRKAWSVALLGVLHERRPVTLVPNSPWIATLLTSMQIKPALAVAGIALALGLLWQNRPVDSLTTAEPNSYGAAELAQPEPDTHTPNKLASAEARDGKRSGLTPEALRIKPRIRVVDETDSPVTDAQVAWINSASHVHTIDLDAIGTALLPNDSEGARFYAAAPDGSTGHVIAGDSALDLIIKLLPSASAHGRVIEDGRVPERSMRLWLSPSDSELNLKSEEWRLLMKLEQLGVVAGSSVAWTHADGSFSFDRLPAGFSGSLFLPSTHLLLEEHSSVLAGEYSRTKVRAGNNQILVRTIKLPSVTGRLVWADNGVPIVGELWVTRATPGGENESGSVSFSDSNGEFAFGLPVTDSAMRLSSKERSQGLLHDKLRFGPRTVNGIAKEFEHSVALKDAVFPLDLGTIHVPRARAIQLLVLGNEDAPLVGAAVTSSIDSGLTDSEGRVELHTEVEDELQALAFGHSWQSFELPTESTATLRLTPGITLAVRIVGGNDQLGATIPIQLSWDTTPFQGADLTTPGDFDALPSRIHDALQPDTFRAAQGSTIKAGAPGWVSFNPAAKGDLLIPGLIGGSTMRIALFDLLEQVLVEREVRLPRTTGIHVVELDPANVNANASNLIVQVVDATSQPLPGGAVFVTYRDTGRGSRFECNDEGRLNLGPLSHGTYELNVYADGRLPVMFDEYVLDSETPPLVVALEPARTLRVFVTDNSGNPLKARNVLLSSDNGWKSELEDAGLDGVKFFNAPKRNLEVSFSIGTRAYRQTIDNVQTEVRVQVPRHGTLTVPFDSPPPLEPPTPNGEDVVLLRVIVREANGDGEVALRHWLDIGDQSAFELQTNLLPGEYTLTTEIIYDLESADPPATVVDTRAVEIR